jgi:hypothetical protein
MRQNVIYAIGIVGIGILTAIWRLLLVRCRLSLDLLYWIEGIYSFGIGAFMGAAALLAADLRPAGYTALMYASYTVFLRAIVVPSSGRRTVLISTLMMMPLWATGIILGIETTQEVPPLAFIVGCSHICAPPPLTVPPPPAQRPRPSASSPQPSLRETRVRRA